MKNPSGLDTEGLVWFEFMTYLLVPEWKSLLRLSLRACVLPSWRDRWPCRDALQVLHQMSSVLQLFSQLLLGLEQIPLLPGLQVQSRLHCLEQRKQR